MNGIDVSHSAEFKGRKRKMLALQNAVSFST
jgi:hypothetical protein